MPGSVRTADGRDALLICHAELVEGSLTFSARRSSSNAHRALKSEILRQAQDDRKELATQQIAHHRLLFLQLRDGRIELRFAEFVQRHILHDLPFSAARSNRERADQAFFDAIA